MPGKTTKMGESSDKNAEGNGDEGSKGTQLIAFRADYDTLKRVKGLETVSKKTRTYVLIHAIQSSYNGIIFENMINQIVPVIKKAFPTAELQQAGFGSKGMLDNDDENFNFELSFNEGTIVFKLPDHKYGTTEKKLYSFLEMLVIKLKIEDLKSTKIEIIKPIIRGSVKKFEPLFFKRAHEIAAKKRLEIKSSSTGDDISFEFLTELYIMHEDAWSKEFKKRIERVKEAVEEMEKEKCFTKEEEKSKQ